MLRRSLVTRRRVQHRSSLIGKDMHYLQNDVSNAVHKIKRAIKFINTIIQRTLVVHLDLKEFSKSLTQRLLQTIERTARSRKEPVT